MDHGHEATVDPVTPTLDRVLTPQATGVALPGDPLPLRVLLRFSRAQHERRFVDHYVAFYFRYAQASLVLGLLLVLGDFLVDYFTHAGVSANFLRLELCMPVLVAGLAYSFTPDARKHWQYAMAGFIVAMALTIFWILLLIDGEGGAGLKTWVGILNFTFLEFYCFVILGVQFRYALASGLLILLAFEAAMCAHAGWSIGDVGYWSYHVITLFILSAGVGWWREYLLRREFSARTALDEARESAERLARMKGDFLATMSHEIRTPMNGVLGMNELLIDSELLPQQRAWAEGVQASGRHLLGVINDILDFSKVESGKIQLEAVDFALVDVLEEAVSMFAQPAESKGLELAVQIGPQAGRLAVRGDPFRLRQVIANLISNAIKFTAEGEVIVRVTVVTQSETEVALSVCVQDTGVGIAPDAQDRIFEDFGQADGSTTRDYGGTGLGLAICKRLIQLMGGVIRVESVPGRGSKFYAEMRLPRASVSAPVTPANGLLHGTRVLVVDDNHSNREILRQHLQGWAMEVTCAAGGSEALQLIEAAGRAGQPFALALLDMRMPGMDGLQLARRIQALSSVPRIKLILLRSPYAGSDPQTRVDLDSLRCVHKPVRQANLAQVVTAILAETSPGLPGATLSRDWSIGARLQGRLLLVEDNGINQRVATSMVERIGLSVCLAVNGAEAVEMVRSQDFDLVLMDCHMPVMDGLEATRRIRSWEATHGHGRSALPIIAMTANAMDGDRDACIAAGMSDYLTKPVTGTQLIEVLARHLAPAEQAPSADAPWLQASAAAQPLHLPVFDPSVLAKLPMVADGTEPEFAWSVLDQFVRESAEGIESCRHAAAVADHDGALRGMHTLKSTSAQLGALVLAAWAGELEHQLRAGKRLDDDSWSRLLAEHGKALLAITTYLAQVRNPEIRGSACMSTELASAHLLLIDDDALLRGMATKTLRHAGFEVSVAASGEAALARFEERPYDLVLLDVMMPGLDGYETCQRIRAMPWGKLVPILMFTGLNDTESIERAYHNGATDFITKPINWTLLSHRVRYALRASQAAERVRQLAHYDEFTGLPNRQFFAELAAPSLEYARRNGTGCAILHVDIDRFAGVNDAFGRIHGDAVLKVTAERLRSWIRSSDLASVGSTHDPRCALARVGGNAFTLLIADLPDQAQAATVARRLQKAIEQPIMVESQSLVLTASIGIALFPGDAADMAALTRCAEQALHAAKATGRAQHRFFDAQMNAFAASRLSLEADLRRGIAQDELRLYFQPKVDAASGVIIGAEALVRWQHPERGLVPPAEFIAVAEETGLIAPLTDWVLEAACRTLRELLDAGLPVVPLSVNLAASSLADAALVSRLDALMQRFGLETSSLRLEMTETMLMGDAEAGIALLQTLRARGYGLSLDDFGTGYSSLSYLKRFSIDELKIDRSFVTDAANGGRHGAVAAAIIALGHELGLQVVAEGVETAEQSAFLLQRGCDVQQGYLFSRPVNTRALQQLLRDGPIASGNARRLASHALES